ncbi:pseudouridine synthase [Streptococcus sp. DD12]|uniref:pseudouridine synthase n=1 Tax=Streptococcus sp. DD12 TaxID=1777880 RepID=UPI00083380A8|nr:16S rRNA pseudouridine(516) synthase [Streptococcus sp. DD12]
MRLDKLLECQGVGSKKRAKRLLQTGQVSIDGEIVRQGSRNCDSGLQAIRIAGQLVKEHAETYYLVHKPIGVVTAVSDSQHPTVIDLVAPEERPEGLYPVGRLDRDTAGLVLLTTNGPLGFQLLHPRYHVTKTYLVTVNGPLLADAPDFFASGVRFHDGTVCQPAQLEILSSQPFSSQARVTLKEGKFHQVKKMFLAYGVKVTGLTRTAFAGLVLEDSLQAGAYRPLTASEQAVIKTFLK